MKNVLVQFHQLNSHITSTPIQVPQSFEHSDLCKYLNLILKHESLYNLYIVNQIFNNTIETMLKNNQLSDEEILRIDYEIINDDYKTDFIYKNDDMISCLKLLEREIYFSDYNGCIFRFDVINKIKTQVYKGSDVIIDVCKNGGCILALAKYNIIDINGDELVIEEENKIDCFAICDKVIVYFCDRKLILFNRENGNKKIILEELKSITKIEIKENKIYILSHDRGFMVININTLEILNKIEHIEMSTFLIDDKVIFGGYKGKMLIYDEYDNNKQEYNINARFVTNLAKYNETIIYSDQYKVYLMNHTLESFKALIEVESEISGLIVYKDYLIVSECDKINFYKLDS